MLMKIPAVAQKEQVVKGTLYEQAKQLVPPEYIIKLEDGSMRIDLDHPDWRNWLSNYHARKNYINADKMKFEALRKSTVEAISEIFKPDQKTMNNLLILIGEKYEASVNGQ